MKKNTKMRNKSIIKKENKKIEILKEILVNMKNSTIYFFKELRKNPKKTLLSLINSIFEVVKNNSLFFVYIILNVAIGILVRYL